MPLCLCKRCLAEDEEGVILSGNVYRVHQLKRSVGEIGADESHPSSSTVTNYIDPAHENPLVPPSSSTGSALPSPLTAAVDISSSRLEIQDIRYQLLGTSFNKPFDLEFGTSNIKPMELPYKYHGLFNAPPYHLVQAPANSLFLEQETRLHAWAQRLAHLESISEESNYQVHLRSVQKNVIYSLNTMYGWKVDLHRQKYGVLPTPTQSSIGTTLIIDTTRYLQLYNMGDPTYSRFVLSGLLLVLVLHLVFNTSNSRCEVVLALLQDQIRALDGLLPPEHLTQLAKSIPRTMKGVLAAFDLDPHVHRYVVCGDCYNLMPISTTPPSHCPYQKTPTSPPCNGKLTRPRIVDGEERHQPITSYLHQDMIQWVGRWICRPHIEATLDRRRTEFHTRWGNTSADALVDDVLNSKAVQDFRWPDNKSMFDCPDNEIRLAFGLTVDGFNPGGNRTAKQSASSTGIYLFCLNLPLEERQKPENVYLVGVIPGPGKPSTSQINHYVALVVEDFLKFWNPGVRYTRTSRRMGVLVRAAILLIMCDALGSRQLCGFGSPTSRFFCTCCWLPLASIENFTPESWPRRTPEQHRHWADQWKEAPNEKTQEELFKNHGIRYSPLLRLPYFDPIKSTVVDTMHNFFLGLFQRHCRFVWGMDVEFEDGDGTLKPHAKMPSQPAAEAMEIARRALEFSNWETLSKSRKEVLFYLCLENDLRRGGRKRDLVRELAKWRDRQGPFWAEPADDEIAGNQVTRVSRTYDPTDSLLASVPGTSTGDGPILLPSESSGDMLDAGEDFLARGLKLNSLKKAILVALCDKRKLPFQPDANKADLIALLDTWRAHHAVKKTAKKKKKRSRTVVLGKSVLGEVAVDMGRLVLPRWVDAAPIRVGQKKQGKLSADQWRTLCTIHLVVTLIRIWGRQPEDSRWFAMLLNYLDLVRAVEAGSMMVTSPQLIEEYRVLIGRYLITMKNLYREAVITANHHYAMHVPDFLRLWGPSPQARGFGWERFNYTLQQIKTNKRFGEIEATFMFAASRAANLLSLLSLGTIREVISNMYTKLHKLVNPDARGTRLHDIARSSHDEVPPSIPSSGGRCQEIRLLEVELEALASTLNSEPDNVIGYLPIHLPPPPPNVKFILLHASATRLASLKQNGTTYRPARQSVGDSNVLLGVTSPCGLPYRPARLEGVFQHQREVRTEDVPSVRQETFCIVRCLKSLSREVIERDWFRKHGHIGGSLWSTEYDESAYVIRPSQIVCHFARTELGRLEGFGSSAYHILPLDRLKTQLESSGPGIKDMDFLFEASSLQFDDDINEEDVDEVDLDMDVDNERST